jgi:glycosyltransferase involved in cell wall biosynthesis
VKGRYRVLHVIDSLNLGGAQAVLVNLIRHGDQSRFEFSVAAMHGRGVYWDAIRALGVRSYSLSFDRRFPSYLPIMAWLCLARRFDIVHTHLIGANVFAKPVAALCGADIRINHVHGNYKSALPWWVLKAERLTNRLSTHVIAVSDSTRRHLIEKERVAGDRITVIHNGIDLELYRPRPELRAGARAQFGLPADAFVIAGVGRLSYEKNFSLYLDVAAAVLAREPRAFFVIAGTGEEGSTLAQKVRSIGIDARVRLLGYVGDMAQLYPAVDMLLLTSRYEGLPMTVLEAMATGTPVVSSRLDGVQEILRDGVDSALVTPGSGEQFAARIVALMRNPALARDYRSAALDKVRAGLSAQANARAVEAVYAKYLRPRLDHAEV